MIHHEFHTNEGTEVHYRRDLFDNPVAYCFFPAEANRELRINLEMELELEERNPFHFLLEEHAQKIPFAYQPIEERMLTPYLSPSDQGSRSGGPIALPFWSAGPGEKDTVELLVELIQALHKNIAYERREDGPARSAWETLQLGHGACRDTSLLLATVLRELGLAARLVSGYLAESETSQTDRRAEGALHAWVEVYLPGAGWVGLDSTNGVLCNHHFISAAVGINPEDVTPVLGSYYGNQTVGSTLHTSLRLDISREASE
uniref:Transglutaminase n=1 Tax=uncultured bacterium 12-5D TaxID=1497524 RepID=A0A059U2F8_9BACT|nr:transglutaminase [uncultured bacterium 12-5D]